MAVINVDDIYILDNTGKQVDDAVDYGLFNSNDNLLDNAYFVGGGSQLGDGIFPINQRGQTSYAGGGTTFDRWRLSSGGSMTLAPEGVSVNGLMFQKKVLDLTVGDTYTLSRRNTNGNIVSVTGIVPSAEGWAVGNQYFGVYFRPSTKLCDIQIWGEYSMQAIKLEKGTYSTLANDVSPDFGEELRKCQKYLFVHKFSAYDVVGNGYAASTTIGGFSICLPVSMRTGGNPQATYTTLPSAYGGGSASNLSTMNLASLKGNIARYYIEFSGIPANNSICVMATTDTTITISNEL